jgi:hypothetical protein
VGALVLAAGGFALLNAGVHVPLRLGFVSFRSVPLAALVFLSFLLGMLSLFLVGLRADVRTRRMLRRYRRALGDEWAGARREGGTEVRED